MTDKPLSGQATEADTRPLLRTGGEDIGAGDGYRPDGAPAADDKPRAKTLARSLAEWVVLIGAAVVIALVIKTFLFQAFFIPSRSMVPTLEVGDRVLVNKLSYDLHDVNRGDIVVFEAKPNRDWQQAGIADLVKRVIALPGETVTQCRPGRICIDGRLLRETYLPERTTTDLASGGPANGDPIPGCAPESPPGGCTVPAGRYFVMGDNRGESSDSRAHGPIIGSSIVGRVFVRIWPVGRVGFL